jgi:hypothetical protein
MTGNIFILGDLPECRSVFAAYLLGIRTTGLKHASGR